MVAGAAALFAGAWWGLVRDDAPSTPRRAGTTTPAADLSEVIDFVPGCRIDTCRVLARRGGFRLEGTTGTLIVVAPTDCAGRSALGLHLVTDKKVLWSEKADVLCFDPVAGIETDRTGNAFMSFVAGAHTFDLIVLRFRGTEVEDFGSLDHRFAGDAAVAEDLDDDGIAEIVVSVNDCDPDCASGKTTDVVYRWNGQDYVET